MLLVLSPQRLAHVLLCSRPIQKITCFSDAYMTTFLDPFEHIILQIKGGGEIALGFIQHYMTSRYQHIEPLFSPKCIS